MRTSEETAGVFQAFTDAAKELTNPAKSETVSTGKYRYTFAPLPDILEDVRGLLGKHGLAVIQEATNSEYGVGVTTRLIHSSGEWIEFGPLVLPANGDAQSHGSAITYARRYALTTALGIAADEDDDGAKAKSPKKASTTAPAAAASAATKGQLRAIEKLAEQKGVDVTTDNLDYEAAKALIQTLQTLKPGETLGETVEGEVVEETTTTETVVVDDTGDDLPQLWERLSEWAGGAEQAQKLVEERIGTRSPSAPQLRELLVELLKAGRS